ncbi:hypothetical protein PFICI_04589 [Pestalotiopsis fici W106-1]|uniref:Uncharacterized protein n=1 Tax=Pestalotiopsis fici (strain W106-1 / CGMCC3.15140) TaxID=1229662 RepID=W3X9B9_PESFW|nr:uncharacterized protein PFICI_04589 [Pestalotiopsis fici W106-1]ETS82713.1 hypothetical protein PFICI_04589 [Pestalotiopsis fici W106-1]
MAPTAMYLSEDISDQISSKKMGLDKSHMFDLNHKGSTPEVSLHDLAVQAPVQSRGGSTTLESNGLKSLHGFGLGSKKYELHTSSSMGSLSGSAAGRHKISGVSSALAMDSQRIEFSEELSAREKSLFMETVEAMEQLAHQSSSMKSLFATMTAERRDIVVTLKQYYARLDRLTLLIQELEEKQKKLKRENESGKTSMLKLTFKLKEAETSIDTYKDKVREREGTISKFQIELEKTQNEIDEIRKTHTMKEAEWTRTQGTIEAVERERDIAQEIIIDLRAQLDKYKENESKMQQSNLVVTEKNEILRRELDLVRGQLTTSERMSDELAHMKRGLEDENRTKQSRIKDLETKLEEANEQYEQIMESYNEVQSVNVTLKSQNSILEQKVRYLKQALQDTNNKLEEAQRKAENASNTVEHLTSKLAMAQKECEALRVEITKMSEKVSKKQEELRIAINEKERILQEYRREMVKSEESNRKVAALEESLRRAESSLKEKTQLHYTLTERIGKMERELNDAVSKYGSLASENKKLEAQASSLQAQIIEVTTRYENASEKLRESEGNDEDLTEKLREAYADHAELERQNAELRRLLNNTREQMDSAISSRVVADQERDQAITRYEEKGREMQKTLEERQEAASRHFHSNGHSSDVHHAVTQSFSNGSVKKKGKKHTTLGTCF